MADSRRARLDASAPSLRAHANPYPSGEFGELDGPMDVRGHDGGNAISDHAGGNLIPDARAADGEDAGPRPTPGLTSCTGRTCLGNSDPYPGCQPERCICAQASYYDDGTVPHEVFCRSGERGCSQPIADEDDPGFAVAQLDHTYTYQSNVDDRAFPILLEISFRPAIEVARTVEEARAALLGGDAFIAQGDRSLLTDFQHFPKRPGPARVEIVSYDDRRIHVRVHREVTVMFGGQNPYRHPCPGDVSHICYDDLCSYADAAHGGKGIPAVNDLDVTFTLPPPISLD